MFLSVCVRVCGDEFTNVCVCGCVREYAFARVALLIQYGRLCAILPAASLSPPHFSTLSHKRHDFRREKVTERKMRSLIFSKTFV